MIYFVLVAGRCETGNTGIDCLKITNTAEYNLEIFINTVSRQNKKEMYTSILELHNVG